MKELVGFSEQIQHQFVAEFRISLEYEVVFCHLVLSTMPRFDL